MNKANDINIRELRISEILKETFILIKSGFKFFLPICLLAFIPINIIELFLPGTALAAALLASPMALFNTEGGDIMRNALLIQLIRHIFTSLVVCGYTYVAMSRYVSRPITLQGVLDYTFSKWLVVALTGILYYGIIFATSIMIFPMVYFAVIFVFNRNIAAVSDERGFKALAASYGLVRGSFFKRMFYAIAFVAMQMGLVFLLVMFIGGLYPSADAPLTVGGGILIVVLNVIMDTLATIFVLAQAVWFVNIFLTRRAGAAFIGQAD